MCLRSMQHVALRVKTTLRTRHYGGASARVCQALGLSKLQALRQALQQALQRTATDAATDTATDTASIWRQALQQALQQGLLASLPQSAWILCK